ncbi:oxidative DNA demethylase [Hanseniaspora uvarum]|nr:oxidative DNA demethylase [Hanseniaspora uvarum]
MTPPEKKQKLNVNKEDLLTDNYILNNLNKDILTSEFVDKKVKEIQESTPYEWGFLDKPFNPVLLNNIRKEIESNISFTEKETDIYRVNQSGDLANLNKLSNEQIVERLPNLYVLQNIIYSKYWRDYISKLLNCGPLSASKTDLSINTYDKGCHLLIHDDVISSRRVSFILYLPDESLDWKVSFGGNLKLYDSFTKNIPMSDASKRFIPQFNSMAFFNVQPGYSFHEVEEVKVDKHRISIQGWYHIPQEGEEGYIKGEEEEWIKQNNSTLKQLKSGSNENNLKNFEFPNSNNYQNIDNFTSVLDEDDKKLLAQYINPKYSIENLAALSESFQASNKLILKNFLHERYAQVLKKDIRQYEINVDAPKDYKSIQHPWKCAWPTNKWRFLYIDGKKFFKITKDKSIDELISEEKALKVNWKELSEDYQNEINTMMEEEGCQSDAFITDDDMDLASENNIIKLLELMTFIQSSTFKKYLTLLSNIDSIKKESIMIRRFRPGYDYTLATTGNNSLDFNLGLTPTQNWDYKNGGYHLYMKNEEAEGEDDDAVYKKNEEDDGVLLNEVPEFNKLVIIKRSKMDLEFVKYLSSSCNGSRWDIQGSYLL